MDNRHNRDQYDQGYQAGWNQQGHQRNQWQDQPDYESDTFVNRNPNQNPSYGEVYHGNLKQREEETNRARGRNFGGMQQGGNQRYGNDYNPGGYGQVGNTGGGHGDWDSHNSGRNDMGGNYDYSNRYGNGGNMNRSNYGQRQRTSDMQYGGGNYNRDRRHDDDNDNWWDRTKQKVASWFDDDDNDDRRRYSGDYGNSDYRGNDYRGNTSQGMGMSGLGHMAGGMSSRMGSSNRSQGEHRGKGPRGYQRSDDRIREDVCDRLYEDGHVDASDIEVKVEGSEVVLSGTVRSREEKRRAEDLVEHIMGVRHVENHIRVNQESNSWMHSGDRMEDHNRMGDSGRMGGDTNRMGDTSRMSDTSRSTTGASSNLENRSYTGNSGDGTGIGSESGTTNEIIRNAGNLDTNQNK